MDKFKPVFPDTVSQHKGASARQLMNKFFSGFGSRDNTENLTLAPCWISSTRTSVHESTQCFLRQTVVRQVQLRLRFTSQHRSAKVNQSTDKSRSVQVLSLVGFTSTQAHLVDVTSLTSHVGWRSPFPFLRFSQRPTVSPVSTSTALRLGLCHLMATVSLQSATVVYHDSRRLYMMHEFVALLQNTSACVVWPR